MKTKRCPACQRQVDSISQFCARCGKQFPKSRKRVWFGLITFLMVCAIVGLFAVRQHPTAIRTVNPADLELVSVPTPAPGFVLDRSRGVSDLKPSDLEGAVPIDDPLGIERRKTTRPARDVFDELAEEFSARERKWGKGVLWKHPDGRYMTFPPQGRENDSPDFIPDSAIKRH
jgi:hypothetical protein